MLSAIRNSIPFHRKRKGAHIHDAVLSGHVLRDIGFESRQVEEILSHVAGAKSDRVTSMVPVKKTSRTRTRSRAAHHALKAINTTVCPKCGSAKLPHAACGRCGYVSAKVTLPQKSEES